MGDRMSCAVPTCPQGPVPSPRTPRNNVSLPADRHEKQFYLPKPHTMGSPVTSADDRAIDHPEPSADDCAGNDDWRRFVPMRLPQLRLPQLPWSRSCHAQTDLEMKMLPAHSAIAQALCGDKGFAWYTIGKVPLKLSALMEVGRVMARVPGDAQHWAFIAAADISHPLVPTAFVIAQFAGHSDPNMTGMMEICLCFTEPECFVAIQRFVGSSGAVHIDNDSWERLHGSPNLQDICARASAWQNRQYSVWTANCQHFATDMTRPYLGSYLDRRFVHQIVSVPQLWEGVHARFKTTTALIAHDESAI